MDSPDGTADAQVRRHSARKSVLYMFCMIILVGLIFFTLSWQYPLMLGQQVGPGFVPCIASAAMITMGVLLLLDELKRGSILEGDGAISVVEEQSGPELKATRKKLIWVGILTPIACLLFPVLGLLPSLTILAFVLSAFVERMPKAASAIVAAATFGVFYLIFVMVLRVPLPFGIFDPQFWSSL